jgi:hypothetical protein
MGAVYERTSWCVDLEAIAVNLNEVYQRTFDALRKVNWQLQLKCSRQST